VVDQAIATDEAPPGEFDPATDGRSGHPEPSPPVVTGPGATRRRWWPPALCCALIVVATLLSFGHLGSLGPGSMTGPRNIDEIIQIWWISFVRSALAHGHNPFFTTWQNYPVGQNAGWNASILALGVLISPVTAAFGPVVAWNVLVRLAVALSAISMCMVLRRWTTWWPAALFGGLLYGFSAYEYVEGAHYLFLSFVALPPIFFLVLHEALVRRRWNPAWVGVLLGVIAGAQYLISPELFASMILVGTLAVVLYLVFNRASLQGGGRYLVRVVAYGVIVGGLLLAVPVGYTLFGPQHITGPLNSPTYLETLHGDLLGPLVPTADQRLTTPGLRNYAAQHLNYTVLMYLGLPLLVFVIGTTWWLRRRGVVVFAAAMAVLCFILSLGPHLWIDGHNTGVLLPMAVLNQLPLTSDFIPARLSGFTSLFVAAVAAFGLEEVHRRLTGARGRHSRASRRTGVAATGLTALIAVVVAIPLLPARAEQVSATATTPYVNSAEARARIPAGSVVLAYPWPSEPLPAPHTRFGYDTAFQMQDELLFDQAVAGIPFKLIGGYGWRPQGPPHAVGIASRLPPESVQQYFDTAYLGFSLPWLPAIPPGANVVDDLRTFLVRYDVGTVVILPIGKHPDAVRSLVTEALGAPSHSDGVTVWYSVQERLDATTG